MQKFMDASCSVPMGDPEVTLWVTIVAVHLAPPTDRAPNPRNSLLYAQRSLRSLHARVYSFGNYPPRTYLSNDRTHLNAWQNRGTSDWLPTNKFHHESSNSDRLTTRHCTFIETRRRYRRHVATDINNCWSFVIGLGASKRMQTQSEYRAIHEKHMCVLCSPDSIQYIILQHSYSDTNSPFYPPTLLLLLLLL